MTEKERTARGAIDEDLVELHTWLLSLRRGLTLISQCHAELSGPVTLETACRLQRFLGAFDRLQRDAPRACARPARAAPARLPRLTSPEADFRMPRSTAAP